MYIVISQCATHRNLGWKIMVTDSVVQYLDTNSGSDIPTTVIGEDSPPTCPILVTTQPPMMTTQPPMMTDPVDGSSYTLHTSLPLFISLILVNTLALLFI